MIEQKAEDIELLIEQNEDGFVVKSIFDKWKDGTEMHLIHGITKTKEEEEYKNKFHKQ